MRASMEDLIDVIFLVIFLIIGAMNVSRALEHITEAVAGYTQEDKTAIKDYSGKVYTEFTYTQDDILFMLAIEDRYSPEPFDFECENMQVSFDPLTKDGKYDGYNFTDCDRVTYIGHLWKDGGLKEIVENPTTYTLNTKAKEEASGKWKSSKWVMVPTS